MDKTEKKIVYAYDTDGKLIGPKTLDWTDRSPVSGDWQIPANCTEISPPIIKDGYDIYWKGTTWGYMKQIKDVTCYYSHGTEFKTVKDIYVAATGEVIFSTTPTTAELESAFPTTAGSRVYTVDTNAISGDTIIICGVTLAAGTSFTVGSDVNITATNIATALNSNEPFATIYKATVSSGIITVTEVFAGDGNTPSAATYTGTVVISSGTAVTSVKGYDTAVKLEKLTALDTEYQTYSLQYDRAYTTAVNSPVLTDAERTANLTAIAAARTALITSRTNGRKSIING